MAKKCCNIAMCLILPHRLANYNFFTWTLAYNLTLLAGHYPSKVFFARYFFLFCVLGFAILDLLLVYVAELQDPKKTSKSIKSKKASDSLRIKLLRKSSAPSSTPPNPNLYRRWQILFSWTPDIFYCFQPGTLLCYLTKLAGFLPGGEPGHRLGQLLCVHDLHPHPPCTCHSLPLLGSSGTWGPFPLASQDCAQVLVANLCKPLCQKTSCKKSCTLSHFLSFLITK